LLRLDDPDRAKKWSTESCWSNLALREIGTNVQALECELKIAGFQAVCEAAFALLCRIPSPRTEPQIRMALV
jgi:hypothetical protein